MSLLPHMAYQASQDDRLTRRDLKVYYLLYTALDPIDFRYAKLTWLRAHTGIREHHISRCLAKLRALGYLQRGPDEPASNGGHPRRTYRLITPPPSNSNPPPPVTQHIA